MTDKELLVKKIKEDTFSINDILLYHEVLGKLADESEEVQKLMEGWNCILNYDFGTSSNIWLKFDNSKITQGSGQHENPDLIYKISEEDTVKMLTGEEDGTQLFLSGRLKITGDLGNAQKFSSISVLTMGEFGSLRPKKEEEGQKSPYMLTQEDNIKIQESLVTKATKMAEMAKMVADYSGDKVYSMGLRLEEFAENIPDKVFLMFEDKKWTHKKFNSEVNRIANYILNNTNLKKGDVAIIFIENRPEMLFLIVALSKIGIISSLININLRDKVLVHSIDYSKAKAFFIGEELIEIFQDIADKLTLDENEKKNLFFVPDTGKNGNPEGFINLYEVSKDFSTDNPPSTKLIRVTDPISYIFTSGTTGLPKAAILDHSRLFMGVASVGHLLCEMTPEDVMYITIPLYHTTAFGIGFGSSLLHGNPIVIRRKFSASQFWQDTRRYNVTIFTYVGEICRYLYNQPPKEDDKDNPVVKMVGNGLRNDYWKDFKTRFGIEKVAELYGATERFVPGFLNIHNLDCTIGTCFLPYAIVKYNTHTDKPILDENGHMIRVKKGEVGLLLGYVSPAEQKNFYIYTDPEQSKKKLFMNVFEDGDMFVNTGDLLRDIGYNHAQFVDRLGDTFRWKSQNVSTEEVEAVLNSYVQIEMSSVYGVLIPNTEGRAGMASIVTNKEEKFKFDSFYDLMKKYLPEYAIPKLIRLKNELDVTGTLKIKKANLKKEGYDLRLVKDPIHILLPGSSDYVPMTQEIFNNVVQGNYKF